LIQKELTPAAEHGIVRLRLRLSRLILGALLLQQAFFLNVLVPGHTRGQITLDGKHEADSVGCAACCCCKQPAVPAKNPAGPSQKDRDQCAICQFVAGLTSVPVVRLTLPELGLLDLLPVPPPAVVVSLDLFPTYQACGPPVDAFCV
jgi:hypothetical protein